ncbi:hypothetical protein AMAG_19208 [Allomyces macrogynus ATCC 38327]|uniref:Uncharacterized protein n=1 Tax=Allomyces macrogynus (strain ATCC 38327) TaxID=578462 RepID=A0A0L0ST86_ALLM3|nr:hypothetical protein AMAG_19208 [Allomyces macrogynus ATCC 38327]|eukprot:KNE65768.1 hypothetical protein AMAG_19208 [Allomyces macrogynus ATCC 38327]
MIAAWAAAVWAANDDLQSWIAPVPHAQRAFDQLVRDLPLDPDLDDELARCLEAWEQRCGLDGLSAANPLPQRVARQRAMIIFLTLLLCNRTLPNATWRWALQSLHSIDAALARAVLAQLTSLFAGTDAPVQACVDVGSSCGEPTRRHDCSMGPDAHPAWVEYQLRPTTLARSGAARLLLDVTPSLDAAALRALLDVDPTTTPEEVEVVALALVMPHAARSDAHVAALTEYLLDAKPSSNSNLTRAPSLLPRLASLPWPLVHVLCRRYPATVWAAYSAALVGMVGDEAQSRRVALASAIPNASLAG